MGKNVQNKGQKCPDIKQESGEKRADSQCHKGK